MSLVECGVHAAGYGSGSAVVQAHGGHAGQDWNAVWARQHRPSFAGCGTGNTAGLLGPDPSPSQRGTRTGNRPKCGAAQGGGRPWFWKDSFCGRQRSGRTSARCAGWKQSGRGEGSERCAPRSPGVATGKGGRRGEASGRVAAAVADRCRAARPGRRAGPPARLRQPSQVANTTRVPGCVRVDGKP